MADKQLADLALAEPMADLPVFGWSDIAAAFVHKLVDHCEAKQTARAEELRDPLDAASLVGHVEESLDANDRVEQACTEIVREEIGRDEFRIDAAPTGISIARGGKIDCRDGAKLSESATEPSRAATDFQDP